MGKKQKAVRWAVLLPPWIVVMGILILNLSSYESFLAVMDTVINWILTHFAWMFNWISLGALVLVVFAYVSPVGKIRLGGENAAPIVTYKNYIWIVLCTIMGSGLMLWACAEPLMHLYNPPANVTAGAGSGDAVLWAMENIFLEWTFTPMAIYALPAVLFAYLFYNRKLSFSIGSMLEPVLGGKVSDSFKSVIDAVCLFCLCMGLSSSLGSGVLLVVQGASHVTGGLITPNATSWSICGAIIIICYIMSAGSGLKRGIQTLSNVNSWFYLALGIFVFAAGPTAYILNLCCESFGAYLSDFFRLSLNTSTAWGDGWSNWWPTFYWCTWLTWMPISAVFLGKISKGYTIRQALVGVFVIPSVFSVVWMALFSETAIKMELDGLGLYAVMQANSMAAAAYELISHLPCAGIIGILFLITAFISYVTSADSNILAIANLCTSGLTENDDEDAQKSKGTLFIKIFWGVTIGGLCIIMLNALGMDGMKMLADLGGFFSAFLMIGFMASFIKVFFIKEK